MGIKNFKKFLEKQCGTSLEIQVPLSDFSGKTIAIDMANLIYIMCSVSTKNVVNQTDLMKESVNQHQINTNTIDLVLGRLTKLLALGITPVCVFDGDQSSNQLKEFAHKKRKESRQLITNKLNAAKEKFETADELFRTPSLEIEYKKYLRQQVNVSWTLTETIKNIVKGCGFPTFVAGDSTNPETSKDGEALCARLCSNGLCDLSFTVDSDYHTFGGTVAIFRLEEEKQYDPITEEFSMQSQVYMRSTQIILESLAKAWNEQNACGPFTFDTFRDICIMLGTDFNPNIFKIGPIKVWTLMKQHGSVQSLSKQIDTSILNYETVVDHFQTGLLPLNIEKPQMNFEQLRNQSRDILSPYRLEKYTTKWSRLLTVSTSG